MTTNYLHERLRGFHPTFGTWIQIGHPASAFVLKTLPFDWIAVDCEHTEIGLGELASIVRGVSKDGPVVLARVSQCSTIEIRRSLDVGVCGVIVPLIESRDDAERAVHAAKFPPTGRRGYSFCWANSFGEDFDAYVRDANEEVVVVVMVETASAVDHIEEILAVDGIDAVFVGPYDLSGSYGLSGQIRHSTVIEAERRVVAACRKAGIPSGLHVVSPDAESIQTALAEGFVFLALGMDTIFLRESASRALAYAQTAGIHKSR